jgi:glycosyltransferase involved in cell wall biosynthesis
MEIKVSVITVCYNSAATIRETIESVLCQSYSNIEYIIVDGASTDDTMKIVSQYGEKITRVISEPDKGIYDAMNKGIKLATGDVIGILNSDDFYASCEVISSIAENFARIDSDIVYGRLVYVLQSDVSVVVRNYNSEGFRNWMLRFGWMPPHPSTFIKATIYKKFGLYATDYKTGADYEMFVRLILLNNVGCAFIPTTIVKMRMGGATTSGWRSYITTSNEMVRAIRNNGFYTNLFFILMRLPIKFFERKWNRD